MRLRVLSGTTVDRLCYDCLILLPRERGATFASMQLSKG
jgi:hypothetical protein